VIILQVTVAETHTISSPPLQEIVDAFPGKTVDFYMMKALFSDDAVHALKRTDCVEYCLGEKTTVKTMEGLKNQIHYFDAIWVMKTTALNGAALQASRRLQEKESLPPQSVYPTSSQVPTSSEVSVPEPGQETRSLQTPGGLPE
jgi:hypothetical protein